MAQQCGLAAAGAPHHRRYLSRPYIKVKVAVDHRRTILGPDSGDFTNDACLTHCPIPLVTMANTASTSITVVIAATTEEVVLEERLSVLGLTRSPKWQAIRVTNTPKVNPLNTANVRFTGTTTWGKRSRKNSMPIPSCILAASMPPKIAQADVQKTSKGATSGSPTTFGRISRKVREIPIVDSASISSVTRITPICAV